MLGSGYLPTARSLLADDLHFKGPIDEFYTADDYLASLAKLASERTCKEPPKADGVTAAARVEPAGLSPVGGSDETCRYAQAVGRQIGEASLGEYARSQVEAVRNDPRLERERGASVADFWDAMEEAERVRAVGIWGLYELERSLEREEAALGFSAADPDLPDFIARQLQAAWERAEMARGEIRNGHPHRNAEALISMNSALDAFVEEFVRAMRKLRARLLLEHVLQRAEEQEPEILGRLTPEARQRMSEVLHSAIARKLPKLKRPRGSGLGRYEPLLEQEGLGEPSDRPIPVDLDRALTELGALRDVLVHRASRVDARALRQAPTLSYQEGDLVRISRDNYRTYSAAIRCYAAEIIFRSIRHWPEASDADGPDLANWRGYYQLGA